MELNILAQGLIIKQLKILTKVFKSEQMYIIQILLNTCLMIGFKPKWVLFSENYFVLWTTLCKKVNAKKCKLIYKFNKIYWL